MPFSNIDDDETELSVKLTRPQYAALKILSDQRAARLVTLIDVTGDMHADGLEFLRRLGDDDHKVVVAFLSRANPETLKFLTSLRDEEVDLLKSGIKMVIAFKWATWSIKWILATAFGAFMSTILIWKEVRGWWR